MAATQVSLPQDDRKRTDITELLQNDAGLRSMIEKIAGHAASSFKWMQVTLDTEQFDDWDPPVRLIITVPYIVRADWSQDYRAFVDWLVAQPDYNPDRLFVMVVPQAMKGTVA